MKSSKIYVIMNCLVISFAVIFFYLYKYETIQSIQPIHFHNAQLLFFLTVLLVQAGKGFRLWFIMYGQGISFWEYLFQYCKTVPVNLVLPFKIGDIFRVYCFGYQVKSYYVGLVDVLLDRFVDTLALMTILLFLSVVYNMRITIYLYVLIFFLFGLIVCYWIFPGLYRYWNRYLLQARISERKLIALKILAQLNHAYKEAASIIEKRCVILYIFSLLIWVIEIGGLLALSSVYEDYADGSIFISYFTSALTGGDNFYLAQFVWLSIILMVAGSLIFWCAKQYKKAGK